MNFHVDTSSSISTHTQLRDQIKFSIAVGRLRPGDPLPSVRNLEKELALDKNKIWRVYQDLARAGLVTLRQGQGAKVNSELPAAVARTLVKDCEAICRRTFEHIARANIHPISFASYFRQYVIRELGGDAGLFFAECNATETEVFANQISEIWSIEVQGVLIDELRTKIQKKPSAKKIKVLTNVYHLDQVRQALRGTVADVIGLNFRWHRRMLKAIESLDEPANVVFVLADGDRRAYGRLIAAEFRSLVGGRRITVAVKPLSEVGDLRRFCHSGNYDLIFFSNRLWDRIPREIKKLPFVSRPTLQIDPAALERARTQAGLIW